jgi:hypothetical protein
VPYVDQAEAAGFVLEILNRGPPDAGTIGDLVN